MQDLVTKDKNTKLKNQNKRIWIDVGAHHGERTLEYAKNDPFLIVYAFEPNIKAASDIFGCHDNFIVIPMAVSRSDGFSTLFLNKWEKASSLLPLNPLGVANWNGNEKLEIEGEVLVPTIRLDTFMSLMNIKKVDLLKIDAQGLDYNVLLSSGDRIKDFYKIILEVEINETNVYKGAAKKEEILKFMKKHGFALFDIEKQSRGQEENLTFVQCINRGEAYMDELKHQAELLDKKREELQNYRIKLKEKNEELESVKSKLKNQEKEINEIKIKLFEQGELANKLICENGKLNAHINAMINSSSWRLTAGLRMLGKLKKLFKMRKNFRF